MCLLATKESVKSLTNERPHKYLSQMVLFMSPNIPMLVNKNFLVYTLLEVKGKNPGLSTVCRSLRLVVLLLSYCCIFHSCHISVSCTITIIIVAVILLVL